MKAMMGTRQFEDHIWGDNLMLLLCLANSGKLGQRGRGRSSFFRLPLRLTGRFLFRQIRRALKVRVLPLPSMPKCRGWRRAGTALSI